MSERERRRKRRQDSDYEDDGLTGWKLGAVVAVIVVCFATIYPTVFHPMLMGFFGSKSAQPAPQPNRPPVHPGMGGAGPRGHHGRSDHPGMRMAMQQAEAQAGGSTGRGMFTWMVPIYMVGFIIFLLYTLFKPKKKRRRNRYESEEDSEEESQQFRGKIGKKKLQTLQERLRQTEEAMSKILEQLEVVQHAQKDADENTDNPEQAGDGQGQYIGDLEKALKQFKDISDAYEKEKDRHLENKSEESEEEDEANLDEEEEEDDDASMEDEEAEELLRQKERELEELRKVEEERKRKQEESKSSAKVRRRSKRV